MDAITLQANGKSYSLKPLKTNELCVLEERLQKTFGELMTDLGVMGAGRLRLSTVRVFLQTCLVGDEVPVEEIGTLIDEIGFDGLASAVNQLIEPAHVKGEE